jgi:RNA polymerase sigma-70 factor (ECF subfamily)
MRSGFLTDDLRDARLIERIKNGDRNAFEALVGPYGKALGSYIAYRVKNGADADDIIQETMLSIWQSVASFDGRSSFKTWLFGIAKRRLADFYRKNGKNDVLPLTDFENALTAKDHLSESIERMDIDMALANLNDGENELVYLVFQAQLSYKEISELLGIPEGTVKSRMSNIKAKLKKLLGGEG